jgi:2-isopropylmalate synthase
MREKEDSHELASFEVEAGSEREPLARVVVKMPSGEEAVGESSGDGPVDAIFLAIQKAADTECELRQYTVEAVTGGEDALGEVTVMLRVAGRLATGQGCGDGHPRASARAYVRALSTPWSAAIPRGRGGPRRARWAHAGPVTFPRATRHTKVTPSAYPRA